MPEEDMKLPSMAELEGKVSEEESRLSRGVRALQRNIRDATKLERGFRKAAKKRAPLRKQLAAAGEAFSGVTDPFARRQLLRGAETAIRARRQEDIGRAQQELAGRLQAQQVGLQFRQQNLANLLSERQQARGIVASQHANELAFERQKELDALQRQRALEDMRAQTALQRELGIGQFAPRTGGGAGTIKSISFGGEDLLIQDGQIIDRADAPQEMSLVDQLLVVLGAQAE